MQSVPYGRGAAPHPEHRQESGALKESMPLLGWASSGTEPQVLSIQEALFAPQVTVPAVESLGRICGAPAVACPLALPIAIAGE